MAEEKKLYFYKCAGEEYSTGHVYFDHSNGIAGYETVQQRTRYLGHSTVDGFERNQVTKAPERNVYGRRAGYTNTNSQYNARY